MRKSKKPPQRAASSKFTKHKPGHMQNRRSNGVKSLVFETDPDRPLRLETAHPKGQEAVAPLQLRTLQTLRCSSGRSFLHLILLQSFALHEHHDYNRKTRGGTGKHRLPAALRCPRIPFYWETSPKSNKPRPQSKSITVGFSPHLLLKIVL